MPLPASSGGLNLRGTIVNHAAVPRYVAGRWRCVIGVNPGESGINLRQSNSRAAHTRQRIALEPRCRSTYGISATTNLEARPRPRALQMSVPKDFPTKFYQTFERSQWIKSCDDALINFVEILETNFEKDLI